MHIIYIIYLYYMVQKETSLYRCRSLDALRPRCW